MNVVTDHGRYAGHGADDADSLELRRYLWALYNRKWLIALFVALSVASAVYYAQTVTPTFRSTATLLIEPQRSGIVPYKESENLAQKSDGYLQTRIETLRSRSLAQAVVAQLGLIDHPEFRRKDRWYDKLLPSVSEAPSDVVDDEREMNVVESFRSRVTVRPVEETNLVRVTVESEDPELAALAANALVGQFIASDLERKRRMTDIASDWLGERLAILEETLNESEQVLLEFKKANQLFDTQGAVQQLNEQELLLTTSELGQARIELADAEELYREIRSSRDDPAQLEALPIVRNDLSYDRAWSELGDLRREISTLRNRFGPKHPSLIDAEAQAAALEETLRRSVDRVMASAEQDYRLKRRRVAALEQKLAAEKQATRQAAQELDSKNIELDVLTREVAANREVYDTFLNKVAETRSARGLESVNAEVIDVAVPSIRPFKPRKRVIVLLAAIVSLALSSLLVLIYEQLDGTVRRPRDVERLLGVSLLGMLPLMKVRRRRRERRLPLDIQGTEESRESGAFLEAVRTIRTNLRLTALGHESKVIVLTSSVPGEGKSTMAINLARAFAREERVVLIDGDLRRPTLTRLLGLDPATPGLAELILGSTKPSLCVQRRALGNLDVICSGSATDQPVELLDAPPFSAVIRVLRKHYDRIIIDSAPIHTVSDSLIVSKQADAVVFVIKWHATSVELARRALEKLWAIRVRVAGAVVTQVNVKSGVARGESYEYQGYYDHYEYYSSTDRSPARHLSFDRMLNLHKARAEASSVDSA